MFYKLMIALLVIGGLAPFTFIKGKDGQPLMSFSDIKMPNTKVPDALKPDLSGFSSEQETVYKWKDADGMWQFSGELPAKGTDFTSTVYDPNMNVIQSVEVVKKVDKKEVIDKKETITNGDFTTASDAYSPEKVKTLMKDANNLDTLLSDRAKQQQEILNNL